MLIGQLSLFPVDPEYQLHISQMLLILSVKLLNGFAGQRCCGLEMGSHCTDGIYLVNTSNKISSTYTLLSLNINACVFFLIHGITKKLSTI